MRILIAHSRYTSGDSSGENRAVEDERKLLEGAGHTVESIEPMLDGDATVHDAIRTVWNRKATDAVRRRSRALGAEAVHVHNLFPNLSPAVPRLLAEDGLPVIMTLQNFRLACLSATFLRNGSLCEDCLGRTPWRGVMHGCYRGSRLQSSVVATSLVVHRALGTFDRVTLFAAVSEFVKNKLVESGLDSDRIRVRHNFAWPSERRVGPGDYFLALGRLSLEKGFASIIPTWSSRTPLLVVGDGPERARLASLAPPGVRFCGAVTADKVPAFLRGARALLVPSTWYEGSPRVIIEALAAGVPVVASRIGGLPELVEDGVSGLLVEPGNDDAWREAVRQLEDDDTAERLGAAAFAAWQERFSPDVSLRSLEALYEEAIALAQADRT